MAVGLDVLRSRLTRDVFLPVAFRLALKLEQATWDEFTTDAGLASYSLRSVQRLFKADGLINWFDDCFEASGVGSKIVRYADGTTGPKPSAPKSLPDAKTFLAAEPIRYVVDLTKRLCSEVGSDATVLGYLTGGATLINYLLPAGTKHEIRKDLERDKFSVPTRRAVEAVAQLSVALANVYCEAGVGALVVVEHDAVDSPAYLRGFDSLFNVARYFNVPIILLCRHAPDAAFVEAARKAGVAHVVSRASKDAKLVAVPCGTAAELASFVAGWSKGGGSRRLVATEWEIPADAAPEDLIALQKKIAA
jgi:uroporphyrinogen-III decarboxylase